MKRGTRNIVVVAVCAVVLGGAVFALTKTGAGGSSASSASSAPDIQLVSKSSADIVSMKVTNRKGSYTLVPEKSGAVSAASGSSSASSSSAAYTVEELSGCPVNTSETGSVVQNGFSLSATKNLGTVSNLGDYGLKSPQATVEVKFKDGSTFGYKVGNATATDSSAYYMCGTNSDNVYVVSVDAGLLEDQNYFITKEMLAIPGSSDSTSSDAATGSAGPDFTQIVLSGSNFPKPVTLQKKDDSLAIVAPDSYTADSNSLSSLESNLTTLTADSVAAVKPDAAALEKYGFTNPTVTAEFTADKKNYKLIVGAKSGKNYYAMVEGVNVVYSVTADSVNGLISQNLFSLRSKLIFLPNIETVKSVAVTSGGKTDVIQVTRKENAASSTQDKKAYTYQVTGNGGKALQYDTNYRNLYERLIGLTIFSDAENKPSGSPAVTIQYGYFDRAGTDKIEFYPADSRHYTVLTNGKVQGLCVKSDVDSMMQYLAKFESGQTIQAS